MAGLSGLSVAVGIGLPLLALALWLDWRRRSHREGPSSADTPDGPSFLRESDIAAMSRPVSDPRPEPSPDATELPAGAADAEFVDVVVEDANVLVIDGAVTDMRELMVPLGRHQPIVVVARSFDAVVLATLAANRRALQLPLIAAVTEEIAAIAHLVGAQTVSVADLRAGYLPAATLGRVRRWRCESGASHVVGCAVTHPPERLDGCLRPPSAKT